MTEFLANLISPLLTPMGVSRADLLVYIGQLGLYLGIAFGALVLMLAVLIGAHWIRKGWKAFARVQSVICFLLAVLLLANAVCYGPMYGPVSAFLNAASVELDEQLVSENLAITERIAAEGFVLLRNENDALPLSDSVTKLNVFGWDSTNPLFGGTGSGSSDGASSTGILASLQMAGYETNEELT